MDNAIHDLLDAITLPWRCSMAELVERYGIRDDGPYRTEVVRVPTRPPLLGGMLRPLEAAAGRQFVSDLPPLAFSGQARQCDDAGFNIRFAADELQAALGAAEVRKRGNILRCDWTSGRAAIALIAWPPEWQDATCNPAHERDPRLRTACHVSVNTGFRPAPTPQDLDRIATYEPFARIAIGNPELMRAHHLEYLRDVDCPAGLRGTVGWSQDRGALIFCDDELHIVAMDDVLGFEVERMLPAKGRGHSMLSVICRTRTRDETAKRLDLTTATGPDDLNEMGASLAGMLGKPCEIAPYEYDA